MCIARPFDERYCWESEQEDKFWDKDTQQSSVRQKYAAA